MLKEGTSLPTVAFNAAVYLFRTRIEGPEVDQLREQLNHLYEKGLFDLVKAT